MSDALESAMRLSQVIGARPAGTEEEQQASFFIEEQLQKAGLSTAVEEFNCNPNYEIPRFICCVITVVLGILAIFLPLMVVIALIVTIITAALFAVEMLGFSPLNNFAKRGISQNIIAKYDPLAHELATEALRADDGTISGSSKHGSRGERGKSRTAARKRKIILVARYDSGRDCPELKAPFFKFLNYIHWAELGGMVLVPLMLLLRVIFDAAGPFLIICDVISIVAIIAAFLPILKYVTHQTAQYSEGANNNASGVSVMIEVAKHIASTAAVAPAPEDVIPGVTEGTAPILVGDDGAPIIADPDATQDLVVLHGRDAIEDARVLPVDTDLVYEEEAGRAPDRNAVMVQAEEAARAQEALERDSMEYDSFDAAEEITPNGSVRAADVRSGSNSMNFAAMMETASNEYRTDSPVIQSSETIRFGDDERNIAQFEELEVEAVDAPKEAAEKSSNMAPRPSNKLGEVKTMGVITGTANANAAVPDWFTAAKSKASAKREERGEKDAPIVRSKFSDALDAAALTSASAIAAMEARENERINAEKIARGEATISTLSKEDGAKLEQLQAQIMGRAAADEAKIEAEVETDIDADVKPHGVDAVFGEVVADGDEEVVEAAASSEDANGAEGEAIVEADVETSADSNEDSEEKAVKDESTIEDVAEMAAVADRTISYIPVAENMNTIEVSEADSKDPIGKTASDILAEAHAAQSEDEEAAKLPEEQAKSERKKRTISLPSITGAIEAMEEQKQAAPLAEDKAKQPSKNAQRRRPGLEGLPSTDLAVQSEDISSQKTVVVSNRADATERITASARSEAEQALASLDLETAQTASAREQAAIANGAEDAFVEEDIQEQDEQGKAVLQQLTPAATSQFEHVRADLIANIESDDIVVGDADDSDYADHTTHTGAMAGPGYVEMPKSRVERLRGLFGRKKKKDDSSFIEAVGIDEDFDARKVGKDRGDWTSFQNESADYDAQIMDGRRHSGQHADRFNRHSISFDSSNINETWDDDAWNDDWNGGGFSLGRKSRAEGADEKRSSRRKPKKKPENSRRLSGDEDSTRRLSPDDYYDEEAYEEEYYDADSGADAYGEMIDEREQIRRFHAGAPVVLNDAPPRASRSSFSELAAFASEVGDEPEIVVEEQVETSGAFQTEVWFVALGAELADNAGIKAFLAHHSDELSGAVVIDLEAMGAGSLSIINEEGTIKTVKAPSRMKRYASKAASALGMKLGSGNIRWRDTAAFFTATKGVQTLHLAGMAAGKPAYFGEADDVWENISDEKLMQNTAFVVELMNLI